MEITQLIEQKQTIRAAAPAAHIKQRINQAAEKLSRQGDMQAQCEKVNEALCNFTTTIYHLDSDGVLANVDAVTFRLLIAAPWGSAGWRKWKIRKWEGEILRRILRTRQESYKPGQRPPLYTYDMEHNGWYVNLPDYPALQDAMFWLRGEIIKLKEWRQCVNGGKHERYRPVSQEVSHRPAYRV